MRNAIQTKENILKAAESEFSKNGLYGARIDQIALAAGANKRMIYAYFNSKESLYRCVLREVYGRLTEIEKHMAGNNESCKQAVCGAIETYFNFLQCNPSFVKLVMWENLNEGAYLEGAGVGPIKRDGLNVLRDVLKRGIQNGEFKQGLDIEQTIISLNTFCFSYFSNSFTLPKVFGLTAQNADQRKVHISEVIMCYICK